MLPSLWKAVAGTPEITWSTRDEDGRFLNLSPEFGRVWRWKDELPERRLVCVGKHVHARTACSTADLPTLIGHERKQVARAVERLQRWLVLTAADLAAVIGCTRKQAAATLDRLVDEGTARRREEEEFVLYLRTRGS